MSKVISGKEYYHKLVRIFNHMEQPSKELVNKMKKINSWYEIR